MVALEVILAVAVYVVIVLVLARAWREWSDRTRRLAQEDARMYVALMHGQERAQRPLDSPHGPYPTRRSSSGGQTPHP